MIDPRWNPSNSSYGQLISHETNLTNYEVSVFVPEISTRVSITEYLNLLIYIENLPEKYKTCPMGLTFDNNDEYIKSYKYYDENYFDGYYDKSNLQNSSIKAMSDWFFNGFSYGFKNQYAVTPEILLTFYP